MGVINYPLNPTAWRIQDRAQSGVYVYSLEGSMLARLGTNGTPSIFLYDKRLKREVEISLDALAGACGK